MLLFELHSTDDGSSGVGSGASVRLWMLDGSEVRTHGQHTAGTKLACTHAPSHRITRPHTYTHTYTYTYTCTPVTPTHLPRAARRARARSCASPPPTPPPSLRRGTPCHTMASRRRARGGDCRCRAALIPRRRHGARRHCSGLEVRLRRQRRRRRALRPRRAAAHPA
eukprot:868449-Prymnesium_polylepis.1